MKPLLVAFAVAAGALTTAGPASAACPPAPFTCFPGCPPPTVYDLTHPQQLITRVCPG